jgi:peptidoglycan hydrolase CwlO-like protein
VIDKAKEELAGLKDKIEDKVSSLKDKLETLEGAAACVKGNEDKAKNVIETSGKIFPQFII